MNLREFCVLFSFHLLYSLIFCCCNLQSFHQRRMPSTTISKSTLCCLLTLVTLLVCCRRTRPFVSYILPERLRLREDFVFHQIFCCCCQFTRKKNSTRLRMCTSIGTGWLPTCGVYAHGLLDVCEWRGGKFAYAYCIINVGCFCVSGLKFYIEFL